MSKGNTEKKLIPGIDETDLATLKAGGIESWLNPQLDPEIDQDEVSERISIRPQGFDQFIGQNNVKKNLILTCSAAKNRGEALDHVLLHGPPGLGKTSLARILASEMGVGFKSTSGPVLERPGDLAAILSSLQPMDLLFIDEIHRMPRATEEVLYPAMEDFHIDILIGQGPAARSIKVDLKPFTLVGATTRTGLLTSPLRDRFGIVERLEFYSASELTAVVTRSAKILGVSIDDLAAQEIGRRARGTPRIANRILRRVRDFAEVNANGKVELNVAKEALQGLDIDDRGLDRMDRLMLEVLIDRYQGGPVGIEALAATIGEDSHTLEEVYEPYLLQEGLIIRTRRGREASPLAYELLGRTLSGGKNLRLF